jgi:beta-xylosidase
MQKFLSAALAFVVATMSSSLFAVEPSSSPYGVCAHLGGGSESRLMPHNLKMMKSAGIDWVRADFSWDGVQHSDKTWHYERTDKLVNMTEQEGISVLAVLNYDVAWAKPAHEHLDEWNTYVRNVVSRYKDRVKYWEVWNEQNIQRFWTGGANAKQYQLLLEATYKTIKSIDPDLKVVYGGLAGIPFDYIKASLEADAGKYFDVFNIHPYRNAMNKNNWVRSYIASLKRLREMLDRNDAKGKPIWITEIGWPTPTAFNTKAGTNKGDIGETILSGILTTLEVNVSEKQQAECLQQAFLISLHSGVERCFWYEFQSPEDDPGEREDHFGLVHRDLSEKPAYRAYKQLTQWRPKGSVVVSGVEFVNGNESRVNWKLPDEKSATATWNPETGKIVVTVNP